MLDQCEQQHHRRTQYARQNEEPDRPPNAHKRRRRNERINRKHDPGIPRHLWQFTVRSDHAYRVGIVPRRQLQKHHDVKPQQRKSGDLGDPTAQIHRRVKGHLAVLTDMPCVRMVVGVGEPAMERFLHIDQRCDPKHSFVQPSAAKRRAMRRFMAHRVGRNAEDNTVNEHGWPHPKRPHACPDQRASQGQRDPPLTQINQAGAVRTRRNGLELFLCKRDIRGGGVCRHIIRHHLARVVGIFIVKDRPKLG